MRRTESFILLDFFIDSVRHVKSILKDFFLILLNKIRKIEICIVLLHVKFRLKQNEYVEMIANTV
jgi:hypothetical protein